MNETNDATPAAPDVCLVNLIGAPAGIGSLKGGFMYKVERRVNGLWFVTSTPYALRKDAEASAKVLARRHGRGNVRVVPCSCA